MQPGSFVAECGYGDASMLFPLLIRRASCSVPLPQHNQRRL